MHQTKWYKFQLNNITLNLHKKIAYLKIKNTVFAIN